MRSSTLGSCTPSAWGRTGHDGTSPPTSGGSGWVSWARRSSWGWQIRRGMVVGRGAPWGHVQSAAGPCFGAGPWSGLYVIPPKKISMILINELV